MHLHHRFYRTTGAFLFCFALWFWIGTTVGQAQAPGPLLNTNPSDGVAGNAIKLGGSGFAPGGYVGTILWDGVPVETIQIPTGGSFIRDFSFPVDAAPGDHTITICRGSPCLVGAAAQQASAAVRVAATAPQLAVKVAYVYDTDTAAAKNFDDLLRRHGIAVTPVQLDEVLKTDFRQFALTLVADDTGNRDSWGNADGQVNQIAKNSKVLGIGEGGYAFFGRLGLAIGYPRGTQGSALDIYLVDPALAVYRTPYNLTGAGVLQVYQDNVPNVALSVTSLGSSTFSTGYQDANGTYSILVSQGCHQLWGFTGDPGKMTPAGRNLFVNSVQQAIGMPCSGVTLQNPCQELFSQADIPAAGLINFDDLPEAATIENHYAALYGVRFANTQTTHATTYGQEPDKAASRPNIALNNAVAPATSAGIPLVITFDESKTHVGFIMGNGETQQPTGILTAYDVTGRLLCRAGNTVPEPHTEFIGLYDAYGRIAAVHLDYGNIALSESIDNLTFAPNSQGWRIQLCQETADRCPPAVGTVYRTNAQSGGDAFAVDAGGYVLGANAIRVGDQLWGLEPITSTSDATIYRTSTLEVVSAGAISGGVQGEPATLRLVVKKQQPLLVQNLTVSAEWYVQGDAERAEWLRANLVKAANYLYSFTDGQFTLGRITVQQDLDGWPDANFRLYRHNALQPKANIGGIVTADTPDPIPGIPFIYSPGHIFMGSSWNRYGVPPNQSVTIKEVEVPPATMVDDWALALAHELGHYLLFLFDTYTGVDGKASQLLADQCTGTAMGDVYKPSNQNFIYEQERWETFCKGTEAHHTLGGRNEWETIRLWYPWVISPTTVVTGPVAPPVNLTTVTFLAPTTSPSEPATSQLFDMLYVGGELTSGEARVFTFRGDRLIEQGKPPKNATQVELIDARVDDRLCVYDVNDHAEGSEIPRHQFGCESIKAGDAEVQMTRDTAWEPLIALTQVSTTSLRLAVTQTLPAGAQVIAKLYPEYGMALEQQILTGTHGVYSYTFEMGGPVTPVYAQLWVDETPGGLSTRREVVADRGTGGSGAFGPASHYGGVLVVSSDGKASFESDQSVELGLGESIAWQSMPGTPPLPLGTAIIGQSYRLDAFPPSLVANGQILIEYETTALLQGASRQVVKLVEPVIYFWDGTSWQALSTTVTTPVNAADGVRVASASSQGVGVYAVLWDLGQNQLFLPLIQH